MTRAGTLWLVRIAARMQEFLETTKDVEEMHCWMEGWIVVWGILLQEWPNYGFEN
jgi:hypothetical protein